LCLRGTGLETWIGAGEYEIRVTNRGRIVTDIAERSQSEIYRLLLCVVGNESLSLTSMMLEAARQGLLIHNLTLPYLPRICG